MLMFSFIVLYSIMTSIFKNTVNTLKQVYISELKPMWMIDLLLSEIKQGFKYQRLVSQKDFLDTCIRRSLCTKVIMDIARKVRNDPSHIKHP